MTTQEQPECGHSASGNGFVWVCDKKPNHTGWHGQTTQLRDGPSTTNWGDDGLSIYSSKDEKRRKESKRTVVY